MTPRYIDVHCHPFLEPLKAEQDAVIQRMKEGGIGGLVVGVDAATSKEAIVTAEKHEHLWATVGLHPNTIEDFDTTIYGSMVDHPKVVAIGECGIDYFRITGDVEKEKKRQWKNFKAQVEFATEHDKPLMLHVRPSKGTMDAYEDMLSYLEPKWKVESGKLRGNVHFFVGNLEIAKKFWSIGFTTSFTGVLTFTHDYDEVVKAAPLDMLLTETDAPYAAPVPYRGQANYPLYVPLIVQAIARIRGEPVESIRDAILENAKRIFALSSPM